MNKMMTGKYEEKNKEEILELKRKWGELKKGFNLLDGMTNNERKRLLESLKKFEQKVAANKDLVKELEKEQIILTDSLGNYTGTYFKIMASWIYIQIIAEEIRSIPDSKNDRERMSILHSLGERLKAYDKALLEMYDAAIKTAESQEKDLAKRMKIGKLNAERFINYTNAQADLIFAKMQNEKIGSVIDKYQDILLNQKYKYRNERMKYIVSKVEKEIKETLAKTKSPPTEMEKATLILALSALDRLKENA